MASNNADCDLASLHTTIVATGGKKWRHEHSVDPALLFWLGSGSNADRGLSVGSQLAVGKKANQPGWTGQPLGAPRRGICIYSGVRFFLIRPDLRLILISGLFPGSHWPDPGDPC